MKQPKNFEDGIAQLEEILQALSLDSTPLAESVKLYARAADLLAYCSAALDKHKLEIEEIDARLAGLREEKHPDEDE